MCCRHSPCGCWRRFFSLAAAWAGHWRSRGAAPAVTVVKVEEREITPAVSFTGRIEAKDKVDLRARVEGFLDQRLFEEGQDVKAGELLFVIEKAPYQAEIENVDATIARAQATLDLAEIERRRQAELVKKQATAQARLDDAAGQGGRGPGRPAAAAGQPDHGRARSRLHRHQGAVRRPDRPRRLLGRRVRRPVRAARWPPSSARTRCTSPSR